MQGQLAANDGAVCASRLARGVDWAAGARLLGWMWLQRVAISDAGAGRRSWGVPGKPRGDAGAAEHLTGIGSYFGRGPAAPEVLRRNPCWWRGLNLRRPEGAGAGGLGRRFWRSRDRLRACLRGWRQRLVRAGYCPAMRGHGRVVLRR